MSVYTQITQDELAEFMSRFDLPPATHFEGVEAGVENTTYFVTAGREWVLQIFEEQGFDEVPFFVELNKRLGDASVPVAIPVPDHDGQRLHTFKGKPAVLFPKLVGRAPLNPNHRQRAALGTALAQMHLASAQMHDMQRDNHRWQSWWEGNQARVQPFLSTAAAHCWPIKFRTRRAGSMASRTCPAASFTAICFGTTACLMATRSPG